MRQKTVLLIGNYRPSLTIARSLSQLCWRIELGVSDSSERNSSADRSRYVADVWRHPSIHHSPAQFEASLRDYLSSRPDIAAVFPVHEDAVHLLSKLHAQTPFASPVVSTDFATVTQCLDKPRMFERCREIGVAHAASETVANANDLRLAVEKIGFPCVVKPTGSAHFLFGLHKAIKVFDWKEFDDVFAEWPQEQSRLIVERHVGGPRHNIYFVAHQGRLLGAVEVKILKTDRSDGTGAAVKGMTVAPSEALCMDTERLVQSLGYTGVGCTQFMCDRQGHSFLELNPRLGANYAIAHQAGLPLAPMALELALGNEGTSPSPLWSYRQGLRFAWTTGALGGIRFELRQGWISRTKAVKQILDALIDGVRAPVHITWSYRDPRPTCQELFRPLLKKSSKKQESPLNAIQHSTATS